MFADSDFGNAFSQLYVYNPAAIDHILNMTMGYVESGMLNGVAMAILAISAVIAATAQAVPDGQERSFLKFYLFAIFGVPLWVWGVNGTKDFDIYDARTGEYYSTVEASNVFAVAAFVNQITAEFSGMNDANVPPGLYDAAQLGMLPFAYSWSAANVIDLSAPEAKLLNSGPTGGADFKRTLRSYIAVCAKAHTEAGKDPVAQLSDPSLDVFAAMRLGDVSGDFDTLVDISIYSQSSNSVVIGLDTCPRAYNLIIDYMQSAVFEEGLEKYVESTVRAQMLGFGWGRDQLDSLVGEGDIFNALSDVINASSWSSIDVYSVAAMGLYMQYLSAELNYGYTGEGVARGVVSTQLYNYINTNANLAKSIASQSFMRDQLAINFGKVQAAALALYPIFILMAICNLRMSKTGLGLIVTSVAFPSLIDFGRQIVEYLSWLDLSETSTFSGTVSHAASVMALTDRVADSTMFFVSFADKLAYAFASILLLTLGMSAHGAASNLTTIATSAPSINPDVDRLQNTSAHRGAADLVGSAPTMGIETTRITSDGGTSSSSTDHEAGVTVGVSSSSEIAHARETAVNSSFNASAAALSSYGAGVNNSLTQAAARDMTSADGLDAGAQESINSEASAAISRAGGADIMRGMNNQQQLEAGVGLANIADYLRRNPGKKGLASSMARGVLSAISPKLATDANVSKMTNAAENMQMSDTTTSALNKQREANLRSSNSFTDQFSSQDAASLSQSFDQETRSEFNKNFEQAQSYGETYRIEEQRSQNGGETQQLDSKQMIESYHQNHSGKYSKDDAYNALTAAGYGHREAHDALRRGINDSKVRGQNREEAGAIRAVASAYANGSLYTRAALMQDDNTREMLRSVFGNEITERSERGGGEAAQRVEQAKQIQTDATEQTRRARVLDIGAGERQYNAGSAQAADVHASNASQAESGEARVRSAHQSAKAVVLKSHESDARPLREEYSKVKEMLGERYEDGLAVGALRFFEGDINKMFEQDKPSETPVPGITDGMSEQESTRFANIIAANAQAAGYSFSGNERNDPLAALSGLKNVMRDKPAEFAAVVSAARQQSIVNAPRTTEANASQLPETFINHPRAAGASSTVAVDAAQSSVQLPQSIAPAPAMAAGDAMAAVSAAQSQQVRDGGVDPRAIGLPAENLLPNRTGDKLSAGQGIVMGERIEAMSRPQQAAAAAAIEQMTGRNRESMGFYKDGTMIDPQRFGVQMSRWAGDQSKNTESLTPAQIASKIESAIPREYISESDKVAAYADAQEGISQRSVLGAAFEGIKDSFVENAAAPVSSVISSRESNKDEREQQLQEVKSESKADNSISYKVAKGAADFVAGAAHLATSVLSPKKLLAPIIAANVGQEAVGKAPDDAKQEMLAAAASDQRREGFIPGSEMTDAQSKIAVNQIEGLPNDMQKAAFMQLVSELPDRDPMSLGFESDGRIADKNVVAASLQEASRRDNGRTNDRQVLETVGAVKGEARAIPASTMAHEIDDAMSGLVVKRSSASELAQSGAAPAQLTDTAAGAERFEVQQPDQAVVPSENISIPVADSASTIESAGSLTEPAAAAVPEIAPMRVQDLLQDTAAYLAKSAPAQSGSRSIPSQSVTHSSAAPAAPGEYIPTDGGVSRPVAQVPTTDRAVADVPAADNAPPPIPAGQQASPDVPTAQSARRIFKLPSRPA